MIGVKSLSEKELRPHRVIYGEKFGYMLEYPCILCYSLAKSIRVIMYQVRKISREDSQYLREPSETTCQTPGEAEAYLQGALHDGTYNASRKTHRFSQNSVEWLMLLQELLGYLGYKAWIYREGSNREVYVLETSAKFLSTSYSPANLQNTSDKIAYIRGFFDAEGETPKNQKDRFYIQLVQKNRPKLVWIRNSLQEIGIKCGKIHNPSKKVDPHYFRFYIATSSHKDFIDKIGSWHPRKSKIFQTRVKI